MANYTGTSGNDSFTGTSDPETIIGDLGGDTLSGAGGRDLIYGDDTLGTDSLGGADSLLGGSGNDTVWAGAGADTVIGGTGLDTIFGGDGDDRIFGDDTTNLDSGSADSISAGAGNDNVVGGGGDDTIDGGTGNDTMQGYAGNDSISGGDGADSISGGTGNDTIAGGSGNDTVFGDEGVDSLTGDDGDDYIQAGFGNDTLSGGAGNDTLYGEDNDDVMSGGDGDDALYGGGGNDAIQGNAGNDTLSGQLGSDTLTGGMGNDTFVVGNNHTAMYVTDFDVTGAGDADSSNNDFVDLSNYYNPTTLAAWNNANPNQTYATPIDWLRADQADNGTLTQGTYTRGSTTYKLNASLKDGDNIVSSANLTKDNTNVVCFTPGVMIEAEGGARAVESLQQGDLVLTRDRGLQPVRWIGARVVTAAELALDPELRPIRIAAFALGNGLPKADLTVSPMHRMVVASSLIEAETGAPEALIAARNLIDLPGVTVVEDGEAVTYIHFMCDQHEMVIANGAATETLNVGVSTAQHLSPAAYAEILALFPELAARAGTPVRKPLPGDWGRNMARRHIEEGLALAI